MAARRESTSKRLEALMKASAIRATQGRQLAELDILDGTGKTFDQVFSFDNDLVFFAFARSAFSLDPKRERDAAILMAFEKAGLDHRNPLDWKALIAVFAEAHFGKARTKPVTWNELSRMQVLQDYLQVKAENPEEDEGGLCKLLQRDKRYRAKYERYNFDAFRKIVRQATSPKHNKLLRHLEISDPILRMYRVEHEDKGLEWTPDIQARLADLIEKAFKVIDPDMK